MKKNLNNNIKNKQFLTDEEIKELLDTQDVDIV